MKIFLDVGAHKGQTARAVKDPRYAFDKIFCFEPSKDCLESIRSINDPRIIIKPYGLWKETRKATLYGDGSMGASIFADKPVADSFKTNEVDLVGASGWIDKNTKLNDIVFMKINCEGCECDIIDDLIESGQIKKIYNVMVHFDVRKIPSMKHREFMTRKKIRKHRIENVCFSDDVMIGESHSDRIQNWLKIVGAEESLPLSALQEKYGKILRSLSRKNSFVNQNMILNSLYLFLKSLIKRAFQKVKIN